MSANTLTHIVPALRPQVDGVGDYALNLAVHLQQTHGISSRFIVCDPQWDGPNSVEGFVVRRLRLRSEAGIWSLLASGKEPQASVLLHYAGYGYHQRGVPLWLYRGLQSWLAEPTGVAAGSPRQFSTVFHESWPSCAKPWSKEFYVRILQQWIVEGLHRRSQLSVTSTRRLQTVLDGIKPHKTLWLPMPSNVPVSERSQTGSCRNGQLRVAIFGQPGARSATVKAHARLLRTLDQKNLLAGAMLLGKGLKAGGPLTEDVELLQKYVSRDRIEVQGELSHEGVSGSLGRSDLFLSQHPGELACKSGALMAALAAGCPAVLRDGRNAAPLKESEHFVASDDSRAGVERFERMTAEGQLERIATAGRLWYERNADWKVIARKYQEALFQEDMGSGASLELAELPTDPLKGGAPRTYAPSRPLADRPLQTRPRPTEAECPVS